MSIRGKCAPVLTMLVLLMGTLSPSQLRASAVLDFARQVGYMSASVGSFYQYQLECVANDASVKGFAATADGIVLQHDTVGSVFYTPRRSEAGEYVQVGDDKIRTTQPRVTEVFEKSSTFNSSGGLPFGPGVAFVVFALWGSPATCTGTINGEPRPVTYLDGSHAFLVGPEAFTGGVLSQDGPEHIALGRTLTVPLKGGPAFAHMKMGSLGWGSLDYNDPANVPYECRTPTGGACDHESPAASSLTATVAAAWDTTGYHGEIIVITLPPNA